MGNCCKKRSHEPFAVKLAKAAEESESQRVRSRFKPIPVEAKTERTQVPKSFKFEAVPTSPPPAKAIQAEEAIKFGYSRRSLKAYYPEPDDATGDSGGSGGSGESGGTESGETQGPKVLPSVSVGTLQKATATGNTNTHSGDCDTPAASPQKITSARNVKPSPPVSGHPKEKESTDTGDSGEKKEEDKKEDK